MPLNQSDVGRSRPIPSNSTLFMGLENLSAERMTSNLSRSFIVNMPPFNLAPSKDSLQPGPLASAINPFFPPITFSEAAHKRPRDSTPQKQTEGSTGTREDDVHAEILTLTGLAVLGTR